MEIIFANELIGNITDTIWLCPAYHGSTYECKIWSVVIIIAHRYIFQVPDVLVYVGDKSGFTIDGETTISGIVS